ncbi:MAG: metallophosphoesterase [Agriterribacter sp.]
MGVFGDCGNNSTNQLNVRNQMINYLGTNYMNVWLLLGDNAYPSGYDAEYSAGFFNIYKDKFLKQNPLFPCPGNHDYDAPNTQNTHSSAYYAAFTMPTAGEAGGYPSGNEAFYSFDIGNIHFISLDSYGNENNSTRLYDTSGAQVQWLKQDLDHNTNKEWIVAYWHHPPFTKGSHDSDIETDLVQIRTKFIKILERYGVDLVLCGHSHDYERSKLQNGFYDVEANFNATVHNVSSSSGLYNGSANACPYYKSEATGNKGTVYVVSGSSGQLGGTTSGYPHNAMYFSNATNGGAIMLEIQGNRLDAKWVGADGTIRDQFTMMKEVNQKKEYTVAVGSPITLQASYTGSYLWTTNEKTASITVTPAAEGSENYIVHDDYNCVADTFTLRVSATLPLTWGIVKAWHIKEEKANKVEWQTFQENNNHHFEVERSSNGRDFLKIATINAANTNSTEHEYVYTDIQLSAAVKNYYYRIRQVDVNGSFSYSPVVVVNVDKPANTFDVQIVPNPGKGYDMKIKLAGGRAQTAALKLYDASGKLFFNKQVTLDVMLKSFIPALPAGTYFLSITTSNQYITKQMVVL